MDTKLSDQMIDISFCLPVYNVQKFLADCLKSISAQDLDKYNINYEIFCIDDGSNDDSYGWLREKARENPHLRVEKNEENKGVSYTRNRLTKEAKGKYIWYIDPDDMLVKGAVRAFYELAEKYDTDVLLGNYIRISEDTSFTGTYECLKKSEEIRAINVNRELPQDQNGKVMCAVWCGIFLREFLLENDLTMNEKMIAQEDTLFYYEFSLRSDRIYKCDLNCYLYRQRLTSVMHSHGDERAKKYYLSMLELLKVYQEHLDNGDYNDIEILKHKIHQSKQSVAQCLAAVTDRKYVKNELRALKEKKIYPYKLRKETLKSKPFYMGLLTFLLPIKPFFWLYHFIYKTAHKSKT